MENVYYYFTNVVVSLLMGNIDTLQTHNTTLDVGTITNQELSFNWTSGPGSQALQDALNQVTNQTQMAAFIQKYLTADYLYGFSAAFGTQVMELLSNPKCWDPSAGPSEMNIINQWNSMVLSTGQNDQNTGQTLVKSENSVLSTDAGAQQPVNDVETSVNLIGANWGNLLQQLYS